MITSDGRDVPRPPLSVTLLGLESASVGEVPVRLYGRLGRTVLAALALEPGRPVTGERLVEALWGPQPPDTARQQVQNQVSRLRRALREAGRADVLHSDASGYRLAVEVTAVDLGWVHRLHMQAAEQQARGRTRRALELLTDARAAWSGPPLSGVTEHFAAMARPAIDELWLTVVEDGLAAALEVGPADVVVRELRSLVRDHPLREPLHQLLVLALHKSDRRADALAAYRETREVLRDELGIDPSPALQRLQRRILAGGEPDDQPNSVSTTRVPAELPRRSPLFVGRQAELARLSSLLSSPGGRSPVAVVTGMAGVGKTARVVEAATLAAASYPDGQLYVDLRGADQKPADPAAVLGAFLRSLGFDPARNHPTWPAGSPSSAPAPLAAGC